MPKCIIFPLLVCFIQVFIAIYIDCYSNLRDIYHSQPNLLASRKMCLGLLVGFFYINDLGQLMYIYILDKNSLAVKKCEANQKQVISNQKFDIK